MGHVIIGVDPHKRSATIEVINEREHSLAQGRFGTDTDGFQAMLAAGRRHQDRRWAVEGCGGVGRHVAQRLVAAGEIVVDVPAKLSARARLFDTGQGRKTDPVDARSVAVVALRSSGLRQIVADDVSAALRLLSDRNDQLARARTQLVSRLHVLLVELIPGGAGKNLSAGQARALLHTVRPREIVGRTRRRLAAELTGELTALDKKITAIKKDLAELITQTGSTLQTLTGIGPVGAARLLGDVTDIHRFSDRGRFASWNGTAPLDASSGEQTRHRLSRAGNRRINRTLHTMALTQLRGDTPGRVYYQQKLAAGKTPREAIRALKRRLSDTVYKQMLADATTRATSPGGHTGATLTSSAADPNPQIDSSESHFPDPPNHSISHP